ncbi:hypothetical protein HK101_010207 [Irineochytrium annulatum]|nr:hypothetical protein HK101_010207 [Irineochytrium annulatum]
MPELPEVERARRLLHDNFLSKKIAGVDTVEDTIVYTGGLTHTDFAKCVRGRTVVDTDRRGKVLVIRLDQAPHMVLHFGMTGSVRVKGQDGLQFMDFSTEDEDWPPRFWKFQVSFEDGTAFVFTDPRRLARIRLLEDPLHEPPISALGFDPIHSMWPMEKFAEVLGRKNTPIKSLLLDQAFSAGVGNWVADEILHMAKIHPLEIAKTLSIDQIAELHRSIVEGKNQRQNAVLPDGKRIEFESLSGRTCAFVPEVQVLRGERPKVKRRVKESEANSDNESNEEDGTSKKRRRTAVKKTRSAMARLEDQGGDDDEDGEEYVPIKKSAQVAKKKNVARKPRKSKTKEVSEDEKEGIEGEDDPTDRAKEGDGADHEDDNDNDSAPKSKRTTKANQTKKSKFFKGDEDAPISTTRRTRSSYF